MKREFVKKKNFEIVNVLLINEVKINICCVKRVGPNVYEFICSMNWGQIYSSSEVAVRSMV